jgi:hypothetical protein
MEYSMYPEKFIRQQVASLQVAITVLDALQPSYTNIRV